MDCKTSHCIQLIGRVPCLPLELDLSVIAVNLNIHVHDHSPLRGQQQFEYDPDHEQRRSNPTPTPGREPVAVIDPQRTVQPAQRAQQRHGHNERADEADGFRRVAEY